MWDNKFLSLNEYARITIFTLDDLALKGLLVTEMEVVDEVETYHVLPIASSESAISL